MNNTQVLGHMAVALLQLSCCQLAGLTARQVGRRLEAGRLGRTACAAAACAAAACAAAACAAAAAYLWRSPYYSLAAASWPG